MANISHYEIIINNIISQLSVEANYTSATLQVETFEEVDFSYTIIIVVYNNEGISSQPTSKRFGMKIHMAVAIHNIQVHLVVS